MFSSASSINGDVCDLSRIYDKKGGYEYSLPQPVLEGFLSGKAFDNSDVYSTEELQNLKEDINNLYQKILSTHPIKEKGAVITAGAPGAGKTTKLRQELEENRFKGKNYAYVCPDDVCLTSQIKTYQADIERSDKSMAARKSAYNKWRPGSNAATYIILANLIREKYAFYFGFTSTSPTTGVFFEFLKKQDYKIRVIHVSATDEVRWDSIQERDQTFVQTTEKDIKEKGFLLPQRINDTFLKYADEIEFYHRQGAHEDTLLAAKWFRNKINASKLGTLEILELNSYQKIKEIHNKAIEVLQKPELSWELTVEESSFINLL